VVRAYGTGVWFKKFIIVMQTEQKKSSTFEVEFFTLNGSQVKQVPAENDVECYKDCDKLVKSPSTAYISFLIKKQL